MPADFVQFGSSASRRAESAEGSVPNSQLAGKSPRQGKLHRVSREQEKHVADKTESVGAMQNRINVVLFLS